MEKKILDQDKIGISPNMLYLYLLPKVHPSMDQQTDRQTDSDNHNTSLTSLAEVIIIIIIIKYWITR